MSDRTTWSPTFRPDSDLDGVHRGPAQLHLDPVGLGPLRIEAEEADQAVGLALGGPAHVEHVVEPLQLDRAVHRQVGPRALGQGAVEVEVDRHRAVLDRGVHPHHVRLDDAVARVDAGLLADLHVLGLGLRDADHGLELAGLGHAREVGARGDALAHLHRELLQHAVHARLELQGLHLGAPQPGRGHALLGHRALHGQLRLDGLARDGQALLLELVAVVQLLGRRPSRAAG